jgi:hypothetical protein
MQFLIWFYAFDVASDTPIMQIYKKNVDISTNKTAQSIIFFFRR